MSETTELIKRLRDGGLSQTEIAKRTGIPQPRLSRWENGEVPDSADDALKIKALVDQLANAAAPNIQTPDAKPLTRFAESVENPTAAEPIEHRKGERRQTESAIAFDPDPRTLLPGRRRADLETEKAR